MEERAKYNAGFDLDELIDNLPAGLDRALLRIFSFHEGKSRIISRNNLLKALKLHGFDVNDRLARACINQMRKDGIVICSMGGINGGYYLAANWEEYNEYKDRELLPRIMDMLEQEKALRQAAEKRWGRFSPEKQLRMGI